MPDLVPVNEFYARLALREMKKEEYRLRRRLSRLDRRMEKIQRDFADALDELARSRTPLEYEIALRNAEIIRLGGCVDPAPGNMSLAPGYRYVDPDYNALFRSVIRSLHCNGIYLEPDILNAARKALVERNFRGLFMAYEQANRVRGMRRGRIEDSDGQAGDLMAASESARQQATQIRLLRGSIDSARSQLKKLYSHPYFTAWRKKKHRQYIEAVCRELRKKIVELDQRIDEMRFENELKRKGGIHGFFSC